MRGNAKHRRTECGGAPPAVGPGRATPALAVALAVALQLFWSGCAEEAPEEKGLPAAGNRDAATDSGVAPDTAAPPPDTTVQPPTGDGSTDTAPVPPACSGQWALPYVGGDNPSCHPEAGDYRPGAADDGWPGCISDDGAYHPFDENISTIARVAAFEEIARLLFTGSPPPPQAFVDALTAYTQPEGLASRVSQREDLHYPAGPKKCAEMTPEEVAQYPDRCVGQARIQPLLNDAFENGARGRDPLLNAARIEAGLLWFLYVSVYKEVTSCTEKKKDCDSSYAYYTGGEPREGGKGLSRYVRTLSRQAHDRVFDGILAFRCWRDLDSGDTAADLALRDRARAQLDRALLRGLALIVKSRLKVARDSATCAEEEAAFLETARILGVALDREATARNPDEATRLRTALAGPTPSEADLDAATAALDALFPCP